MPKIDWTPGRGRRGRPLRRVLGMGQQQGLLVMYGLAVVAVVFAMAAAFGAFDDSGSPTSGRPSGADTAPGISGGAVSPPAPKDATKTTQILLGSVQHYADLLADGQKIVGHTHYADMTAYGNAFSDPNSPASQFSKFRTSPNPESDTTYLDAERQAAAAYGGDHGGRLDQWLKDMAKLKSDMGDWVATAGQYQQGTAPQAALDTAAAAVTQDIATARTTAESLSH
ncbi:hypothetical protein ABH926_001557 [Catenulispora sp. GP43]|uniref:hypothetical protein n=1 Tax=Catenulispora sp. GP43 TaxID=3156263 RepID=UPI0035113734